MRSRATRAEHQAAVERRLAQLSAELASARGEASPRPEVEVAPAAGGEWWSDHTVVPGRLHVVPEVPPHDALGDPTPTPLPEPVPLPARRGPEPGGERVVRAPGRHAAGRRGSRARVLVEEVVPESLRGRALIGPAQLAVVAVVVAIGAFVTAVLVVRSDPEPPEVTVAAGQEGSPLVPLPTAGAAAAPGSAGGDADPSASGGGAALPAGSAAGTVTVDVAGKVRRPGIAVLDAGARVVDALEAAGGARPGVDLSTLNLARPLVDGEQILVGEAAAPVAAPVPGGVAPGAPPGVPALVDLNTATAEQLDALPEVGPVTAAAIIGWREQNGAFTAVEELLEVDGIGEATLAQIAPHATV